MSVTAGGLLDRDALDIDALRTDRYLDALLAALERRARDVPADSALDPAVRFAARRLQDDLVRVHPSFRFEERLADRLAFVADRLAAGDAPEVALTAAAAASPALGRVIAFASVASGDAFDPAGLEPAEFEPDEFDALAYDLERSRASALRGAPALGGLSGLAGLASLPGRIPRRPVLVGGAVTSAALSLAGAMYVAWRLSRTDDDPMARAVRAAHPFRLGRAATSAVAASQGGLGGLA